MLKPSRAKILVLSASEESRSFVRSLFSGEEFEVYDVSAAAELFRAVSDVRPGLIILYPDSPADGGDAVCNSLKDNPQSSSIPVLQIAPAPGNYNTRADVYLIAPVEPAELIINTKALLRLMAERSRRRKQDQQKSVAPPASRQEIEERMREQRLALAVGIAELGTWSFNLLTEKLEISVEQAAIFGYGDRQEMKTPDEWRSRIHPDDLDWVEKRLRDVIAGTRDYDVEYRVVWPDDSVHWVTSKAKLLSDENQRPIRLIGVTRDITARRQREQAFRALLECAKGAGKDYFNCLVRALAESFQVRYAFVAEIDPRRLAQAKTLAVWANGKPGDNFAYALEGTPCEGVLNQGIGFYPVGVAKLFPKDERLARLRVEGYLGALLRNTAGSVMGLMVMMHDRPVNSNLQPLSLLQMFAGQSAVAMEKERAEKALREGEAQLRLVMEAADVGTWDWHIKDNYSRWGGRHAQLFGLPEETPGVSFDEFLSMVHSDDRQMLEQSTARSIENGEEFRTEFRIIRPDGEIRWMQNRGHAYQDMEGNPARVMGIVQDVTERKEFEMQLRQSEAQLHMATTGAGVGLWFWDLQLGELVWTDQCKALFGLPPDTVMTYEVFLNALHPDDRQYTDETVRRAIAGDEYKIEYRAVWVDGSVHWLSARGNVLYNSSGKAIKMVGVAWDVTRRKETEFALLASEERYRALVQAGAQIVWSISPSGSGPELRQWWERVTGQSEEEARNWGWLNVLHPDDREAARAAWQHSLETFSEFHTEYRVRNRQGDHRYLSVSGVPLWNVDKTFREWVGTITDITERKKDELALRESNAILTAINQSTEDLIYVKDLEGRFLLINPAFARTFGNDRAAIIGKTDFELLEMNEAARIRESDLHVLQTGRTEIVEETLTLAKGARVFLSTKSPYFDEKGAIIGLISISTDITERKRAEKERDQLLEREQAAREEAQAANRAKDEFLAVVSHELRAPLNAMLGWTRILQSPEIDAATQKRALETIERSARLQAQIIEDLLDTTRIISGKLKLEVRSMHLSSVIHSALEIMRPAAAAKQIDIQVNLDEESDFITGDPERLQQVIWNLLSNAIKFNRTGGRVEVILRRVDPYVQIVVCDTGKGINAELLNHIFDRFYQADSSSKRRAGGLGLGLPLVRHLVELHGGTITAESAGEGQGSTFTVNLPVRAVRARTGTLKSPFAAGRTDTRPALPLEGLWILVVDDEMDARDLLTVLLKSYGAAVTAAPSAASAMDIIIAGQEGRRPDLIISDIGMPDEDGYMFMRRVRSLAPQFGGQIPAIAVTAFGQPSNRIQALEAGFQSHVPKPVEAEELKMVIASLAGRAIKRVNS